MLIAFVRQLSACLCLFISLYRIASWPSVGKTLLLDAYVVVYANCLRLSAFRLSVGKTLLLDAYVVVYDNCLRLSAFRLSLPFC